MTKFTRSTTLLCNIHLLWPMTDDAQSMFHSPRCLTTRSPSATYSEDLSWASCLRLFWDNWRKKHVFYQGISKLTLLKLWELQRGQQRQREWHKTRGLMSKNNLSAGEFTWTNFHVHEHELMAANVFFIFFYFDTVHCNLALDSSPAFSQLSKLE